MICWNVANLSVEEAALNALVLEWDSSEEWDFALVQELSSVSKVRQIELARGHVVIISPTTRGRSLGIFIHSRWSWCIGRSIQGGRWMGVEISGAVDFLFVNLHLRPQTGRRRRAVEDECKEELNSIADHLCNYAKYPWIFGVR